MTDPKLEAAARELEVLLSRVRPDWGTNGDDVLSAFRAALDEPKRPPCMGDYCAGCPECVPEPAPDTAIERRPVREIAREFAVKWNWEHVTWGQQDWIDGRGEQIDDDTAKLAETVGALLRAERGDK